MNPPPLPNSPQPPPLPRAKKTHWVWIAGPVLVLLILLGYGIRQFSQVADIARSAALAVRLMNYANSGRYKEGIEIAEREFPTVPPTAQLYFAMENLYYGTNDLAHTKYYAEKTLEADPGNEMAIRYMIGICRDFDDNDAGYRAGKAWIARNSHGTDVYKDLALVTVDAGHREEAFGYAAEGFRRKPENPRIASVYFYFSCRTKGVPQTLQEADGWLAKNKPDAYFWAQLGKGLTSADAWQEALPRLQRAIAEGSDDIEVATQIFDCYQHLRDTESAVRFSEKYLLTHRPTRDYWNNLGAVHYRYKNYELALSAFQKAQALDPKSATSAANIMFTLYELKRSREAVAVGQSWIEQPGATPTEHFFRATAFANYALNRWSEAERAYRAALAIQPDSSNDARDLISVLLKQHRPQEAVEFGRAWQAKHPDAKDAAFDANLRKAIAAASAGATPNSED